MNAKKIKNADTETMGNKTQRSVLDGNGVATGQSNSGSRASNGRAKKLLADTGESKAAKAKTRRAKKKMTKLQELRAKSPLKTVTERKGRGKKGNASNSAGNTAVNRKLNQERAKCHAIEFQLKRTFGI